MRAHLLVALLLLAAVPPILAAADTTERSPHPPIRIVGDEGFEQCTCVTGGSGTLEDPYRVRGWVIDLTAYRRTAETGHTGADLGQEQTSRFPGIELRGTTDHVVLENLTVLDEGPREGQLENEQTVGLSLLSAQNVSVRNLTIDGPWAAVQWWGDIPHVDIDGLDATVGRFNAFTDIQSAVGNAIAFNWDRYSSLGPDELDAAHDQLVEYVPPYDQPTRVTLRNATVHVGLRSQGLNDEANVFGLAASQVVLDNLTLAPLEGTQARLVRVTYGPGSLFQGLDLTVSDGFFVCHLTCEGTRMSDLELQENVLFSLRQRTRTSQEVAGLTVWCDGHNPWCHQDDAATWVQNVQADGYFQVHGLHHVRGGSFERLLHQIEPDQHQALDRPQGYFLEHVEAAAVSTLRVDQPVHVFDTRFRAGVVLHDYREEPTQATLFNVRAGGLPVVQVDPGDPRRIDQPVGAAVVHGGATVEHLRVEPPNPEVFPWSGGSVQGPLVVGEDVRLGNVSFRGMAQQALFLQGGTVTNLTVEGTRGEGRYDRLWKGIELGPGDARIEDLRVRADPHWTTAVDLSIEAENVTGLDWDLREVHSGIARACEARHGGLCRSLDLENALVHATEHALRAYGSLQTTHAPSAGPLVARHVDLLANETVAAGEEVHLEEANLRTTPLGTHFVVGPQADVRVTTAWFDRGTPLVRWCDRCDVDAAPSTRLSVSDVRRSPINDPPTVRLATGELPASPGPVPVRASVGDDWRTAAEPTWTVDGAPAGAGATIAPVLDHGIHTAAATTTDHLGATARAGLDLPVWDGQTVLAYIPPVAPPQRDQTVTLEARTWGPVDTRSWDVGADGTIEGTGDNVSFPMSEPTVPVRLTANGTDGSVHHHTRSVAAQDTAPSAAVTGPAEAPTLQPLTLEDASVDDWGLAERAWDIGADGTVDATGPNLTLTPDRPGLLVVRLAVTDLAGQRDTAEHVVQLHQGEASIGLGLTPLAPTTADTVQLTADAGSAWAWDVGADGTVEGRAPTLLWRFHEPGEHVVALEATVEGQPLNVTAVLSVAPVDPTAAIAAAPADHGALALTAVVADEGSWRAHWDLDEDGQPDLVGRQVTFHPPGAGTHTVGLAVIDDDGQRAQVGRHLTVPAPTAPLSLAPWPALGAAPLEATVRVETPAPLPAVTGYRIDHDGDGAWDVNGTPPVPTAFTVALDAPGIAAPRMELSADGVVLAKANTTVEARDPSAFPPSADVAVDGLGPGLVEDEPLAVTVQAEARLGLTGVHACTTTCNQTRLSGSADTATLGLPTPPAGTPLTVEVTDQAGNTNTTTRVLDVAENRPPALAVDDTPQPALTTFELPVRASDPEGRPLSLSWHIGPAQGAGPPAPLRLAAGSYPSEVRAQDPSGAETTWTGDVVVDEGLWATVVPLAVAPDDVPVGTPLTFLVTASTSHGPATNVSGELTLAYRLIEGVSLSMGSWSVTEAHQVVETDQRMPPGTVVARASLEAGPGPEDPLPSRDAVRAEVVLRSWHRYRKPLNRGLTLHASRTNVGDRVATWARGVTWHPCAFGSH